MKRNIIIKWFKSSCWKVNLPNIELTEKDVEKLEWMDYKNMTPQFLRAYLFLKK